MVVLVPHFLDVFESINSDYCSAQKIEPNSDRRENKKKQRRMEQKPLRIKSDLCQCWWKKIASYVSSVQSRESNATHVKSVMSSFEWHILSNLIIWNLFAEIKSVNTLRKENWRWNEILRWVFWQVFDFEKKNTVQFIGRYSFCDENLIFF